MKISAQIFQLLMEAADQQNPSISHSVLSSELGEECVKFLLKESYLERGRDLETYWLSGEDADVEIEWIEKLQSFVYLSRRGKLVPIKDEELKTYDVNFGRISDFIAKELDVFPSSRNKQSEYLEGLLHFVGEAQIQKRRVAVFFARRVTHHIALNQIEEFFIKESPTSLPKLILTSSNYLSPESLRTSKAKIISIPKLLKSAKEKSILNMDYIGNVLFANAGDELKAHVRCTEDGSTLFVGDKSWIIKGDKQRQIIKVMCDLYAENPDGEMRWNIVLSMAELDESTSRFKDFFKDSAIKEAIAHAKGFVWFKTEENL